MIDKAKSLPWRVLVIEDDNLKRQSIRKVLESLGLTYDSARSANEARVLMRQCSYHLLSLDQRIPDIFGEMTTLTSGADLDKSSAHLTPLALKIFYSAEMSLDHSPATEVKEAAMIAGRLSAPIWHKSSHDNPSENKYKDEGWGQALVEHLGQQYLPHYLSCGQDLLPAPLARCCADLNNKFGLNAQDHDEPQSLVKDANNWPYIAEQWLRFYEITLLLSVAQAHLWAPRAPCSALSCAASSLMTQLERYYGHGSDNELKSWCRYTANKDGDSGLLQDHKQRLAWLKKGVRGNRGNNAWDHKTFLQLMLPVLATAEYWATRPLISKVRQLSPGRYQAKRISSASWPWPNIEFDFKPAADEGEPDPDAVYLCLPMETSSAKKLQELSPLLHLHRNPENNKLQLRACLRPDPQVRENWLCHNFDDGTLDAWHPDADTRRRLRDLWG